MEFTEHEYKLANTFHGKVVRHLQLLASREQQLEYQENVPIADVTAELFCLWEGYYGPEFLKQNYYQAAFSPSEFAALAEFDVMMNEVGDSLYAGKPHSPYITEWINTPLWQRMADAAKVALQAFPPHEITESL